ncbi:WW domain binding protein 11 [Kalmanozyma brasiliensis GHG001]|uniref:WW domain binding protein 11 n=1 Tax=Kalmanozyma brasiliensis (strain GHG001) TaxID=1365824 RepID=UPI002868021C|nr:WW domain binding protein 11 [Kalmanozyma brasiliensis GHG001]KAF6767550.1 WW domain binding protein 11 [Kalmanozyma brasiliensis GHG001]
MARSADPVQAARKAAGKREAKRNRERKEQAQEARTLRQDTHSLERQIQRLEARQDTLSEEDREELKRLQAEVAKIKRIKEDYLRKHPDQRNFVRGYEETSVGSSSAKPGQANVTQPQHLPLRGDAPTPQSKQRDPRWSIYYDATFNPYGAPPPGMPYLEKPYAQLVEEGLIDAAKPPPLPEETDGAGEDSDDSSTDEELKDIVMPSGPPPIRLLSSGAGSRSHTRRGRGQPDLSRDGAHGAGRGGRGRGSALPHQHGPRQGPNHSRGGHAGPHHVPGGLSPRPPSTSRSIPVRPPAPMASAPASASTQGPAPPGPPGPPPSVPDGVVISAEPQLRNFKKESTAFVPAAIRKKQQEEKARTKRGMPGRIDAAPVSNDATDSYEASAKDKPDLLKSVQAHLPSKVADQRSSGSQSKKSDYDRFLDEVGDLL